MGPDVIQLASTRESETNISPTFKLLLFRVDRREETLLCSGAGEEFRQTSWVQIVA